MAPFSPILTLLRRLIPLTLLLGCILAVTPAAAEPPLSASPALPPPFTLAVTPAYQVDSHLTGGGSVSQFRVLVDAGAETAFSETLGVGVHVAYEYTDYHFSGLTLFGTGRPWDTLHRLEFGGSVGYDLTPEWSIYVTPTVQFSRADDAGWGNALVYGGDLWISRDIGKDLTLGLGAEVLSELEQVSVIPLVVITWRITDRLLLANPTRTSPSGEDGLELAYRIADGWEVASGAAYRSTRFRLKRTGTFDDTIGAVSDFPAWMRLGRKMGGNFNLDCYAGAVIGSQLSIDDRDGNRFASTRVDLTPFLALAVSGRF